MRSAVVLLLLAASPTAALDPKDVIVVANKNVPASREVAEHYLARRKVPANNLIVLDLPTGEDISRADYDKRLAGPLREALKDRKAAAKVILTVYGVPLRVGGQPPTSDERKELDKLHPELAAARQGAAVLGSIGGFFPNSVAIFRQQAERLDRRRRILSHAESHACVDSELMLLWWDKYPLDRWVMNPLYVRAADGSRNGSPPVLLTCRLDGPSPEIAKRLVDDAVAVA
jgi:uncharacterized protein (TIGR03790 family)